MTTGRRNASWVRRELAPAVVVAEATPAEKRRTVAVAALAVSAAALVMAGKQAVVTRAALAIR
jgi:hypothetical protein